MLSSFVRKCGKYVLYAPGATGFLLASCFFSFLLTVVRYLFTGSLYYAWLNWNLFLAVIPYLFSSLLLVKPQLIEKTSVFLLVFCAWLLFLPNTFYIITDLFHLEHRAPVPLWFDTALLFSFVWNGIMLGFLSIRQMELAWKAKFHGGSAVMIFLLIFLNALGAYVGRYLRYNSWDVVSNPAGLSQDIFYLLIHPLRNRHDWEMIGCYTLVIGLVYVSLKKLGTVRA